MTEYRAPGRVHSPYSEKKKIEAEKAFEIIELVAFMFTGLRASSASEGMNPALPQHAGCHSLKSLPASSFFVHRSQLCVSSRQRRGLRAERSAIRRLGPVRT